MAIRSAITAVRSLRAKALRLKGLPALRAVAIGTSLLIAGTSSLQNAVANGDTRTITLHHTHSGESGSFTFKKNGRYDAEVLAQLNHFLRDWRNQKSTQMDPALFDIVWEVYRETDATAPIQIVSSYRSPETNSMLRARSSGVAKFSQHMLGRAMDFYIPGVNLTDLRVAGLRLQRGGVGFYPTSGSPFVHMDTGNVRHWPRMTHDQLARVFPDGKTVHVGTDGRPLSGYAAALAEIQARGSKAGVAVASADGGKGVKKFFSGLFGKKDADDDEGGETTTVAAADTAAEDATPARAGSKAAPAIVQVATAPVPPSRPAEIATGALVAANASLFAPLPQRRPAEAGGRDNRVASLTAPGSNAASVPLPTVITRGVASEEGPALGYASPGPLSEQRSTLSGGMMPNAAAPTVAHAPAPAGKQRARVAEVTFGRLFLSPSLSTELYLRTPELRQLATFMAPPHEVVASAFSRDGSFGLKSRFSGTAVADLPTYVFRAPAIAYTQRM
ncbi:DUF882 domain-containing protein [Xanthobacter oligotrophicus]|uniref:DUF882 domain-containing protein n=1 Tax=Xanthobacter oligotrophicus TaxID=2607286 RepID=UPI001E324A08|nr:DUF882 domain-containing protein [Xanthobacter oligotrophicus]MCG5234915.1 DUF882 domain-containing protein [Xanthobacter oligotrophicus]